MTAPGAGGTPTACGDTAPPLKTFQKHLEIGHLQASPGDQVKDLLNLDDYVKAHTVLVQNMLRPILGC